jgi:hypothetical protein
MLIILQYILFWILIGIVTWFLKVFIYFRGPTDYANWISVLFNSINHKETANHIKNNPRSFVLSGIITYSVIGPFAVLDFFLTILHIRSFLKNVK